jgi:uncharacterized membrane protein (UPF0136 family)
LKLSTEQLVYRGYNLMICLVLTLSGLAFGAVLFAEEDLADKVDDTGLLIVAIIAALWYLFGGRRYVRSIVPVALAALALVIQLVAVPLESDDKTAFGDNIGGLMLFIPFLVFAIYQYRKTATLATSN